MEIKKLLEEIAQLEHEIRNADHLLNIVESSGIRLVVVAANNANYRGAADQEFLIDAVKSKRNEMHQRIVKLIDAVGVVEKIIDGLIA